MNFSLNLEVLLEWEYPQLKRKSWLVARRICKRPTAIREKGVFLGIRQAFGGMVSGEQPSFGSRSYSWNRKDEGALSLMSEVSNFGAWRISWNDRT